MKPRKEVSFSEWTEDALIAALEDKLNHTSESEDPFPLVRPILDQLDQKTGAAPFDLEKNWEALYPETKKKPLPFGLLLTAAVLLLCAALCGLASMFGLHEKWNAFFHAEGPQSSLLLPLTDEPEASVQKDGITVNVLQTITDTMGVYVLYEITVPDSVTLPDNIAYVDQLLIPSFPLDAQDRLGGAGAVKCWRVPLTASWCSAIRWKITVYPWTCPSACISLQPQPCVLRRGRRCSPFGRQRTPWS